MRKEFVLLTTAFSLLLMACEAVVTGTLPVTPKDPALFARFEDELEEIHEKLKIPGFSAAIVQDQELVWAKVFGYADLENKILATPETPY